MTSPGNQHCANCIGTLSFPMAQLPKSRGQRWGRVQRAGNSSWRGTANPVICGSDRAF